MYPHLLPYLEKAIAELNNFLKGEPKELYAPQQYIISLGGKRVRPLLALIGNDLFNGNITDAIPVAKTVELFHTFSLIHDDIMDKAPLRRGSGTVHEKWNTNIAILSGDAMLVKAYQCLNEVNGKHLQILLSLFNRTAIEVCEGQQYDMNFESLNRVGIEEYIKMITLKTAVLLGCSLQMGAITAGAEPENQKHLYNFGKEIGIAFQLKDDILDVYAENEKFGKQSGGDIIANKKTFLLLKCLELANDKQLAEINKWIDTKEFNSDEKITAVKSVYQELNIYEIANQEVKKHYDSAVKNLDLINCDVAKKQQMLSFAEQLMNRNH